jgi:ADP-ribosylglycohydrolase
MGMYGGTNLSPLQGVKMVNTKTRSRARGAIVGTAIGDALGMPVEGLDPVTIASKFGRLHSMVAPMSGTWARHTHNLRRGQWTDDTQLMLAIGESVVSKGFLDFDDIAKRHVLCLNDPRGWGKSTLTGIGRIKAGVSWWNSAAHDGAGNGTPMKIAPLGILLALGKINEFEARTAVINISRMTHGDPRPAIAGIIQMDAVAKAILRGPAGIHTGLQYSPAFAEQLEIAFGVSTEDEQGYRSLSQALRLAIEMCNKHMTLSEIRDVIGARSFVVESFPFTVAAVLKYCDNPEACLIELAAQGGDADTTCAMAGALLGAAHGLSSFPERWRRPLEGYTRLVALADGLCGPKNLNDSRQNVLSQRPRILFGKQQEKRTDQIMLLKVPK